jgi:hypothetical protein
MPDPHQDDPHQRPDFMATLGLFPPYTVEDVKQAYMVKIRTAHPDHGGDAEEFRRIQEAYEQAQEYLAIRSDRRGWIASQMDNYLAQQAVEDRLRELGGECTSQHTDWLQKSFGDFAELTSAVESIELSDSPAGNEVIDLIVRHQAAMQRLKRLTLVGCGVSIDRALQLSRFKLLQSIDLRRNKLDKRIAELVPALPQLRELQVDRAAVGWLGAMQLGRQLRQRQQRSPAAGL